MRFPRRTESVLSLIHIFRETQPLPGAPEFRQWSLPFEALERVTDRLGQEYGISREPVVADRVYALVMNAPQELYPAVSYTHLFFAGM